jgi:hypothetical protein
MKIVDRKAFLKMPEGTLFCKYDPCVFGEMHVKGSTWGDDFLLKRAFGEVACDNGAELDDVLETARISGESFNLDFDCLGRDGLFDSGQLFAIWEKSDIEGFQSLLSRAISGMPV